MQSQMNIKRTTEVIVSIDGKKILTATGLDGKDSSALFLASDTRAINNGLQFYFGDDLMSLLIWYQAYFVCEGFRSINSNNKHMIKFRLNQKLQIFIEMWWIDAKTQIILTHQRRKRHLLQHWMISDPVKMHLNKRQ